MICITGKQLADKIAIDNNINKQFCNEFVKELFKVIAKEIKDGKNVTLTGFGQFKSVFVPEKEYRTPDGKEGICKAKRAMKFTMGTKLEDFLKGDIDEI